MRRPPPFRVPPPPVPPFAVVTRVGRLQEGASDPRPVPVSVRGRETYVTVEGRGGFPGRAHLIFGQITAGPWMGGWTLLIDGYGEAPPDKEPFALDQFIQQRWGAAVRAELTPIRGGA